ncbi:hypothetical protein EAH89_11395 [Roseomonas nepalensis]|uniref:Uncharacterized protein n=1 Tax=Muricoccus nepalensis TaxID=1854500 RepID=A0A502G618_9PROT|nr:hypothetical protein [Roseomonas nepalensis]TPG57517.1 hypothetical protein EAH89_11395 [Roseomonas nepalensis]
MTVAKPVLRRDLVALLAVAAAIGLMVAYRHVYVEPRAWGALCLDLAQAPLACQPRAVLLWLQHWQLWGAVAMGLGIWAFVGAPFPVRAAAVAMGVIAVLNFNATWGMVGAALGGWAWVEASARAARPAAPSGRTGRGATP